MRKNLFVLLLVMLQSVCPVAGASPRHIELDFDFSGGSDHQFIPLFRDLPQNIFQEYELRKNRGQSLGPRAPLEKGPGEYPEDASHWLLNSGIFPLPDGLIDYGFLVQGTNRSDDLDYGIGKFLDHANGLEPETEYIATFQIDLAANGGTGGLGAGGGQTINLAAILTTTDAHEYRLDHGHVRWHRNIADALSKAPSVGSNIVCHIGMSLPGKTRCPSGRIPFEVTIGRESKPFRFRTNNRAQAWLIISGHSGFESFAAFYFTRVQIWLQKVQH